MIANRKSKFLVATGVAIILIIAILFGTYYLVYSSIDDNLTISDDGKQIVLNDITYEKVINPIEIRKLEDEISYSDETIKNVKFNNRITSITIVEKYKVVIISDVFGNDYYIMEVES